MVSQKKENDLIEGTKRYLENLEGLQKTASVLNDFGVVDDPNVLADRLVLLAAYCARAAELAAYFGALYERAFNARKDERILAGESATKAEGSAKAEFAHLKELALHSEGIIEAIARISANYNRVLDWKQAEIDRLGKRG